MKGQTLLASTVMLDLMPVGVVLTNRDGIIEYANERLCGILGYKKEDLLGKKPNVWKSNNHTYGFYKEMWKVISSGRSWSGVVQNRRSDGSLFWASLDIVPVNLEEDFSGYMGVMRDVSKEYNEIHRALEYYETLYLDLLNSVKIGFGIVDQHRNLVYANVQLRRWFSHGGDLESIMAGLLDLPFVSCCIDKTFETKLSHEITLEINGGFFRFTTFPILRGSVFSGVIIVLIDITKEKAIERELDLYREFLEEEVENRTYALKLAKKDIELQAMELKEAHENLKMLYEEVKRSNERLQELDRLKTEFVFTVSHELRTPLTTIREGVALVLDEVLGPITDEQRDMLETVLSDVDRLARIVSDFLDLARIESGKMKLEKREVNLRSVISRVCKSFQETARQKGVELKCEVDDLYLECDEDRIYQVLVNLVGNALKFTEEGYVKVFVRQGEGEVVICVEDTGTGVEEDQKEKIFDKFYQIGRKDGPGTQGTGLGLPISKALIDLHGGRMWIEDVEPKGARFCFSLPKGGRLKRGWEDGSQDLGNR